MADGQAALLGRSKKVLMETKMSVQTLTGTRDIREQTGPAAAALPFFVYRIYKAFLAHVLFVPLHLVSKHCKVLVAHFLIVLGESRRQEAARVIHRYRHLIDGEGYCD